MKPLLTALLVFGTGTIAFTQANTKLSNLVAPTAVSQTLLPNTTNTKDLGNTTLTWRHLYLRGDIYLDATRFVSNHPGTNQYNAFLGSNAGRSTTAINNTALGHNALYVNTTGYSNTTSGAFSLYNNTTGFSNIAVGVRALNTNTTGFRNMAIGDSAMFTNTTGYRNTAIGYQSLFSNSTGSANVAVGEETLRNNTIGSVNSAFGGIALYRNTTGSTNTALGYGTLQNNTTGNLNNAIGYGALEGNKGGSANNALGVHALKNNTTGSYNTAVGDLALQNTYTAQQNTAIGNRAGRNFDNGYNNVFVGANTEVNGPGYYNVIAIGQGTLCTAPSQVTIGNPATTSYRVYKSWSIISDGRYKKNLREEVPGLAFISKLRPVTYTLDASGLDQFLNKGRENREQPSTEAQAVMQNALKEKEALVQTGFIAQEVEKAAQELQYNFSGVHKPADDKDVYGLSYSEFVVPLVKAVQEQQEQIEQQKGENEALKVRITKLEEMVLKLAEGANSNITGMGALSQNNPNPAKGTTRIGYSVPSGANRAQLLLTDKLGRLVKTIPVAPAAAGTAVLNTSLLSSGVYNYSLVVDGKTVETKKMVVVHDK